MPDKRTKWGGRVGDAAGAEGWMERVSERIWG